MEDKQKKSGGCSVITIIGIGLALLPVLYLFSVGPATALLNHGWLPMDMTGSFYSPLNHLGNWSPSFQKFLSWYCGLWNF